MLKKHLVFTVAVASMFVGTTVMTALFLVKIVSQTSEKYPSDRNNATAVLDEDGNIIPDVPETNSPSSSPWKEELDTKTTPPPSNTLSSRSKFPYNFHATTPPSSSIKFPTQPSFVSTPSVISVVKPAKQPKPSITSHALNIFFHPPVTSPSPSVSLSPMEEDSTSPSFTQTPSSIAWTTIPSPIPSESPTESSSPPNSSPTKSPT